MKASTSAKPILWLSDGRGVYLPRDFAKGFANRAKSVIGVDVEDWLILEAGPDHKHYWEVWDDVLANAVVTDGDGTRYRLYQDGDLWLIPEGMKWRDDKEWFAWDKEERK